MPYEDGKLMNPNLVDYKMIRATEMPPANIAEIDTYEPEGPYGAKEAGEGLTNPTAAAIGNALFHRFGVQMKECPIRPEMILNALQEKAEQDKTAGKDKPGRRNNLSEGEDTMGDPIICPVCGKKAKTGSAIDCARHMFGTGDKPHRHGLMRRACPLLIF